MPWQDPEQHRDPLMPTTRTHTSSKRSVSEKDAEKIAARLGAVAEKLRERAYKGAAAF